MEAGISRTIEAIRAADRDGIEVLTPTFTQRRVPSGGNAARPYIQS
jgi:hypothetical protein